MVRTRDTEPSQCWTFQRGLDELRADLETTGARQATLAYYENHARILLRAWDGDTPLHAITADDIRTYARIRLGHGVSVSTVWGKELQVLQRVCNLAVRRGAMPSSPFRQLPRPKIRSHRRDTIPVEELSELVGQVRQWQDSPARQAQRDADILTVAMLTGMRRAELARLRPRDVDLGSGQLFVEGKNENRHLPITAQLREPLERLLASCRDRVVGSERLIEKVFARWRDRLGEPRLTPRALRHGFATTLAGSGVTPFVLRELMGHANLRQTQRYYHSQGAQNRDAMKKIGNLLDAPRPPDLDGESPATP